MLTSFGSLCRRRSKEFFHSYERGEFGWRSFFDHVDGKSQEALVVAPLPGKTAYCVDNKSNNKFATDGAVAAQGRCIVVSLPARPSLGLSVLCFLEIWKSYFYFPSCLFISFVGVQPKKKRASIIFFPPKSHTHSRGQYVGTMMPIKPDKECFASAGPGRILHCTAVGPGELVIGLFGRSRCPLAPENWLNGGKGKATESCCH